MVTADGPGLIATGVNDKSFSSSDGEFIANGISSSSSSVSGMHFSMLRSTDTALILPATRVLDEEVPSLPCPPLAVLSSSSSTTPSIGEDDKSEDPPSLFISILIATNARVSPKWATATALLPTSSEAANIFAARSMLERPPGWGFPTESNLFTACTIAPPAFLFPDAKVPIIPTRSPPVPGLVLSIPMPLVRFFKLLLLRPAPEFVPPGDEGA
mmetsp:Transcript_41647/g.76994  ORF Transcript_41647/g.76994 Transcript_41647/m.76994 type:complete len:214 (-) Transcript_41647:861-1502(-)